MQLSELLSNEASKDVNPITKTLSARLKGFKGFKDVEFFATKFLYKNMRFSPDLECVRSFMHVTRQEKLW
jgi:hypothetical protein